MNEELLFLEPKILWKEFRNILEIPRCSKNERKIVKYLENWAIKNNIDYIKEECGNIIMNSPGSPGMEDCETIILQAHMDMVCDKIKTSTHDFRKDPIETKIKDNWVYANNTTLGADNGIGIASCLGILSDPHVKHGPLQCIFTVDEETGLTGAGKLDANNINGHILINLDSEDTNEIIIGCAGGIDTNIKIFYEKEKAKEDYIPLKIEVSKLKGGHSGEDINRNRGNAIKLLNRILWDANKKFNIQIQEINGGSLRNAIAREASAIIFINKTYKNDFNELINDKLKEFKKEFESSEKDISIKVCEISTDNYNIIDSKTQENILNGIYTCPHGVISMSQKIKNLPETSTNLASIKTEENYFYIETSQRSSLESSLNNAKNMVKSCFDLVNGEIEFKGSYPGWEPNPNSKICNIAKNIFIREFNKAPQIKAIHAGLECGLIASKIDGIDMISIGPTIKGIHSPEEAIEIKSVNKFWNFLCNILEEAPKIKN